MIVKGTVHPKIELFQPRWGAAALVTPPLTPPLTPSPTRCAGTHSAAEGAAAALEVAKGSERPQKDVKRFGNATETKTVPGTGRQKKSEFGFPT